MDAVMDILRRNHQAWPCSNDGRPSMMTESAPVLPSLHPSLTHFLFWYTVSKCASSPSRLLSCTLATYRATSSRTLKWERSPRLSRCWACSVGIAFHTLGYSIPRH